MRYLIQERIFSLTNDFWIEDENGNQAFYVDGKALSLRETFELRDPSGMLRAVIRKKVLAVRDTMNIEDEAGVLATVRPALFSPFRHRYEIELADGSSLDAVGNFADKDWQVVTGDGIVMAQISRQWFRIRDTYGVDVAPGGDDAVMMAIAVCIDRLHEDQEPRPGPERLPALEPGQPVRCSRLGPTPAGPGHKPKTFSWWKLFCIVVEKVSSISFWTAKTSSRWVARDD